MVEKEREREIERAENKEKKYNRCNNLR